MRWRFADKLGGFRPWQALIGTKAVSLEEYSLLEPFGREGAMPRSLVLEACVETARWLVARSSEWTASCVLDGVEDLAFARDAGMGHVLAISIEVVGRDGDLLKASARVACEQKQIAEGAIAVRVVPLDEGFDRGMVEGLWQELYAPA